MSLRLRAAAYSPNGARLGILPTPQGIMGSMVLGDVGGFSISYPQNGPKSPWLATACEVALEVSYDDGQTWAEPNDARFLRLRRKGDQVDAPNVVAYEGPSYLWLLDKSPVLPEGALNAEGKRPFLTATVGTIMRSLIQEAQARGELPGLDATTFSAALDSNGVAWGTVVTIYYEPGLSYLTILRNLADQGLCDFTMAGRSLRIYKPDTIMGGASGATLRKGRDLTEAPYTGTLEGIASHAFLMGDGGVTFERTNPAAPTPWGRWTTFISQGGVSDTGTMTVLSDSTLALAAEERVENTYGLDFSLASALPFRDYSLGKTVAVASGNDVPVSLRLRQVTLTRDEKGTVQGNVVLNDRFLENEVRQSRRIQGITGGSSLDGGSGGRPDDGADRTTPKAPTGLTVGSVAYLDDDGKAWALVTLDWADVTENTDNTAITDLAGYEAFYRFASGGAWTSMGTIESGPISRGQFQANTGYDFTVQAIDTATPPHRSALAAAITDVTEADATAPGKPSTPTAVAYLGQGLLGWNGLLDAGGSAPLDFARAEFHLSTVTGFAPSPATLVDATSSRAGGSTVATGLTYGVPYYVKVVLYDRTGNASTPSNQATFTPVKMGGIDLGLGVVGYDALAFKQSGNQVPDGTFENAEYRADLTASGMSAGWAFQNVAANATSGRWSLVLTGTTGPGTQRNVRLLGSRGVTIPGVAAPLTGMRVSPGEKWLMRWQAKGTTNGSLGGFWTVYGADGAFINFLLSPALVQGAAFGTLSWVATMPAGAAYAIPYLEARTTITTGTTYVDDVEIRPIIGTLLVDDAAITNAKIADMAVDKITAGALSAAITISGRIATALTGARVEINSTGIKSYDAGGLLAVDIPVTGGATFSGTIKTGATGARVEVLPVTGGGALRIYSGFGTETAPGSVSSVIQGDAPAHNAALYLVSPKRSTYAQCTLVLQSADSDGAASAGLYLDRGDLQIWSTATAGFVWGGINLRNSTGTAWGQILRETSGARFHSATGDVRMSALGDARVSAGANADIGLEALTGTIVMAATTVQHYGGPFKMQDTWARGISSAAAVGIGADGTLYHITSSKRYKRDIQDAEFDVASLIKGLRPRTFLDKREYEENGKDTKGLKRHLGLIAEEVATIPVLGDLIVPRDDKGRPNEVRYDRVAIALIAWLNDLERRLAAQEATQGPVGSSA